jgi:hypothetical protein
VAEFDSDDPVFCLLREEKKKRERERKMARVFFLGPEARHDLLAMLCGIFMAVRCN